MKEILKNLGNMGKTVIISSHILPELSDMCDTIGIMQKGSLIMHGTVEEIQNNAINASSLNIQVLGEVEPAIRLIKEDPGTKQLSVREDGIVVDYDGDDLAKARLLQKLVENKIMIGSFYKEKADLETLFLEITSEKNMEEKAGGVNDEICN